MIARKLPLLSALRLFRYLLIPILLLSASSGWAQIKKTVLKGYVIDGSINERLYSVRIALDSDTLTTITNSNGNYKLRVEPGDHSITFSAAGYQAKKIAVIRIPKSGITYFNVVLKPLANRDLDSIPASSARDSVDRADSASTTDVLSEKQLFFKSAVQDFHRIETIGTEEISAGTDKNGVMLLKRLNGVLVNNHQTSPHVQSLTVRGMGERYNQVTLNGALLNNLDPLSRSFALEFIPTESIEAVSVSKFNDASLPADFAGGSVNIETKEGTDRDFFYILAGGGFFDQTTGKAFSGDKRDKLEWLGLGGKIRDLPAEFPTTRSEFSLRQKNIQEQVRFSQQLRNNLTPLNYGNSKPNDRVMLGFGRKFNLKGGNTISLISYLQHRRSERIDEITVQAAPNVAGNKFPFNASQRLIQAGSQDMRYQSAADLSGVLNASIDFGRSKIAVKNIFSSIFNNTYTHRDQFFRISTSSDSLANKGINFLTESRKFLVSQVLGQHALGEDGKFKLDWNATYTLNTQKNPDERNFLLNQNPADSNLFAIAGNNSTGVGDQEVGIFTNSSRLWRNLTEHSFSGALSLKIPFNLLNQGHLLEGGVNMQLRNRDFTSDLLLFRNQTYQTLNNLMTGENYHPGDLSAINYFQTLEPDKIGDLSGYNFTHMGNYTASSNIGASYINLKAAVLKNLRADFGIRVESSSYLVSNSQFNYQKGFKSPRKFMLDQNDKVVEFAVLPSAVLKFLPLENFSIGSAYFRSINRPQLQELSTYRYYDMSRFTVFAGNRTLRNSDIQNFEAEIAVGSKHRLHLSLKGFYKVINQPIEYVSESYSVSLPGTYRATPYNMPEGVVTGIEASFKSGLGFLTTEGWADKISVFAGTTMLKSKVKTGYIRSLQNPEIHEHKLAGSPNFTLNAGLTLQQNSIPEISLIYNRISDYLIEVGSGTFTTLANKNRVPAIPNSYVKGMNYFDIQVSQRFYRSKGQLTAGVNNLLKASFITYQDLNGNGKLDSPLKLQSDAIGRRLFYQSGTDNTTQSVTGQRTFYFTASYLF